MTPRRVLSSVAVALGLVVWTAADTGGQTTNAAPSIELTGTIDPATAGWIQSALDDAERSEAPFAIIRLDTPGGLDTSMRDIIRRFGATPFPVVVYVSPNGARAASAGMFITLGSDVAVMAPQTNIGSATPVTLSGGETDEVLGRKIRNDAAAYARALAEAHDRNADLAEQMVQDAVNIPASEALQRNLIELVADDQDQVLRMLDGFRVPGPKQRTLDTDGVQLQQRDMPLGYEIRQILVNPTVAYLLLLTGLLAILLEITSAGFGAAGVFGAIALVLGFYGSAQLPVTMAGIILLALAVGFFVAEASAPSFGVFGAAGIAALVLSGLLLFDTDSEVVSMSVPVAVAGGVLLGGFTLFAMSRALAAQHAQPRLEADELVGQIGQVRAPLDPEGLIYIQGALWKARADPGAKTKKSMPVGTRVRVDSVHGMVLIVEEAEKETA